MKKLLISTAVAGNVLAATWLQTCAAPRSRVPVTPAADTLFTSTRQITSIAATNGEVWVGTLGGVLRRTREGQWRKFTRRDGLPAQEVRQIKISGSNAPEILLPTTNVQWQDGKWQKTNDVLQAPNAAQPVAVEWNGQPVEASWKGMRIKRYNKWQDIRLPPSKGTHVSALLPRAGVLWAAMFGEGLWEYSGATWKAVSIGLPAQAREITALAEDAQSKALWLGTRRDGLWEYSGGTWTQHLQPDEPYEHNGQALVSFKGDLFLTTLEDGLAVRTGDGWQQLGDTTLSSNAPRQMVEFKGALYVRHGGGKIDRFDGTSWKRNVFPWLPRQKAMSIATDGRRLFVAQWGGWSEWDGKTWEHFLRLPELQGLPLMSLQPDGDTLWIGTQSRGIVEATRTIEAAATPTADNKISKASQTLSPALPQVSYKIQWHDERHGLPDDWVTCLSTTGKTIYAGTYVGGLAYRTGERWQHLEELGGENVTAIEADGSGGLYIATRTGVWQKTHTGVLWRLNDDIAFLDSEAQALCKVPQGLWVATRTGLYFVTGQSLQPKTDVVAQRNKE